MDNDEHRRLAQEVKINRLVCQYSAKEEEWRCPKCGVQVDERYDCCEVHALTTPPAPDEAVEAELNLDDYRSAPSGVGPLAFTWQDKPHRLLYDLIKALRLQRARSRRDVGGSE